MSPSRIATLLTLVLLGGASLSADSHPQPRIRITPRMALNAGVVVEVFVPRHETHRKMTLVVDGPVYRSTEEMLEGEAARSTFPPLIIRSLPEGEYEVSLTVTHADGSTDWTRDTFCRGEGCIKGMDR